MKNKIFLYSLILIVFYSSISFAASPYFFKGFVFINGSLAPSGTIIEAFNPIDSSVPVSSVTIGQDLLAGLDAGKYVISFEASPGDNISFKVNGINLFPENGTNTANQTLSTGIVTDNFNLSINKSANGLACSYAVGCTSALCVHNVCRASSPFCGDGFCDSSESCASDNSACSSGQACTNGCVATSGNSGTGGTSGSGGGTITPAVSETTAPQPLDTSVTTEFTISTVNASSLGIQQIDVSVSENTSAATITVKETTAPSQTAPPVAPSDGTVYKYLDITPSFSNAIVKEVKIQFKVPKSWYTSNGIVPETTILQHLVNNEWIPLPTRQLSFDGTIYAFEATSTGFSAYAITGSKIQSSCGNNVVDSGEDCDGTNLGGFTCSSLGYKSGDLKCSSSCKFDKSQCTNSVCGNNIKESGEDCDGRDLGGQTCATKGFAGGTLLCTSCRLDTSSCFGQQGGYQPPISAPGPTGIIYTIVILAIIALAGYWHYYKRPAKKAAV